MTSSLEQGSLSPDLKYNTFRKFLNNGCVVERFSRRNFHSNNGQCNAHVEN